MKKILAILAIAIGSTAMAADKIELGYRVDTDRATNTEQNVMSISWKTDISKAVSFGLDANLSERQTDQRLTNRYSAGVDYSQGIYYVSGKIGQKNQSLKSAVDFYTVEGGLKFPINKNLNGKVGYQYRQAFASNVDDLQKGYRAALDYSVNKTYAVGVKYDLMEDSKGVKTDRWGVAVSKRF